MKKLIILLFLSFAIYGQSFQQDTMNVDFSVDAPDSVISQIAAYRVFIETYSLPNSAQLYSGMPLALAMSIGGDVVGTNLTIPFSYSLIANGDQFTVAVFGLDSNGGELEYQINYDRYFIRCGVAFGTLPLIPEITDHQIYINVEVNFQ
ncbi:hypothetical protein KAR91_39535 [Candidatus Pacearchaeota archaeon]|nr:hypothetical protein [Candidatus Pacearchaeota archaeon]